MSERRSRNAAEWTTLGISLAVLVGVFALVAIQLRNPDAAPVPTARVKQVRAVGDRFHVDVEVTNEGDRTAANVQVNAEIQGIDGAISGDQTIDFLPGGGEQQLTFIFDDDPTTHELEVRVTGFTNP